MIRHLLLACCLVITILQCAAQTSNELNAAEFEKAIEAPDTAQLLDVRTAAEFKTGHIRDAMLADWKDENEFTRRVSYINKEKPVYVYCLAGSRSAAAAARMREMGFKKVYELTGGINAWKQENKRLEGRLVEKQMTTAELQEAITKSRVTLVNFGASWCPPCQKMEPGLAVLLKNNPGKFSLVKVDGGRDEEIMAAYKISTLPVLILFKDGKQVWRKDGVAEAQEITDLLD